MPARRRPRRTAAVVGLVAGLALLLAAVLDGGMATPTRTDLSAGVATAAPAAPGDLVAGVAQAREDHPPWGRTVPSLGIAVVLAVLVALAAAAVTSGVRPAATGPRHRAPALATARHRGPPSLV